VCVCVCVRVRVRVRVCVRARACRIKTSMYIKDSKILFIFLEDK